MVFTAGHTRHYAAMKSHSLRGSHGNVSHDNVSHGESVLCRRFGDATVMRQQMTHLTEASELPNVELRVHRLDGTDPPLTTGAFSYMQFPQTDAVPLHDIVSVEHLEGSYYLEDEEHTNRYRVAFEYLLERSLDPVQSRLVIAAAARDIRQDGQ